MNRFFTSLTIYHAAVLGACLAGASYTFGISIIGAVWCLAMTYFTRNMK